MGAATPAGPIVLLWGIAAPFKVSVHCRETVKHLRATVRADPEDSPTLFGLLAHSPHLEVARVVEQTTTPDGVETYFATVEGDVDAFVEAAAATEGIVSVDAYRFADEPPYVLLVHRPPVDTEVEAERREAAHHGVVLRTPIVYRDGAMHLRAIGDPGQLQRTIDRGPTGMTVTVEEVGTFRGGLDTPHADLTDRQREALETAAELGYYEMPRGATHEDVADALGCAPQTASDHLQKAEAAVVRATLDGLRRPTGDGP
jgi:predicted DNA binding protein